MKFFVVGQNLKVSQTIIASGTARFLTADFIFSPEWDGLRKYAHFEQGEKKYPVLISGDQITADKNLNLGKGVWNVWIHGNRFDEDQNFQRITTVVVQIEVDPSGKCGDVLPIEPPSFGEQLDARVAALEAGGVGPGGSGGTTDHEKLSNREKPNQHPMEAITGLVALRDRINAFLDSDDQTLDQLTELIQAIKANQGTIESITTGKINVSDIVNDLTTGGAKKVLSADMGVELKRLIDAIEVPDLAAQVEAAQQAAQQAAGSASNASGAAESANAAADRAESAQSAANGSAITAANKADQAAQSAQEASTAKQSAEGSAQTASTKASEAARSATDAKTNVNNALQEAKTSGEFDGGYYSIKFTQEPGSDTVTVSFEASDPGMPEIPPQTITLPKVPGGGGTGGGPANASELAATVPTGLPSSTEQNVQAILNALAQGKEIFIAKYGETTKQELDEAREAGKMLFCRYALFGYLFSSSIASSFYTFLGYELLEDGIQFTDLHMSTGGKWLPVKRAKIPYAGPAPSVDLGVTGATVGQIFEIEQVDESGKPIKIKAVNKPTGGAGGGESPSGGEKQWRLIGSADLRGSWASVTFDRDTEGKPFRLKDVIFVVSGGAAKKWTSINDRKDGGATGWYTQKFEKVADGVTNRLRNGSYETEDFYNGQPFATKLYLQMSDGQTDGHVDVYGRDA